MRPELTSGFQRSKNMEYATEHIKAFAADLDAVREKAEVQPEEGKELTEEERK